MVWRSMRNGELKDKANAQLAPALDHINRMMNLGPHDEDPNGKNRDWAKHARKAIRNAQKTVDKMKGKAKELMQQKIDRLSKQVDDLADRVF